MRLVLLLHTAATLFMVGLIWFVQIVHYPLFMQVRADSFVLYEVTQNRLTLLVVAPAMLLEAATAIFLLFSRPPAISAPLAYLGVLLLAVIWISTFFIQMPRHAILAQGFNETVWHSLMLTNWIRTITWSLRGVLSLWMDFKLMK